MTELISRSSFAEINSYNLEGGLQKLCEYGKPRLACMGNDEWYCTIEMFVQGEGVEFKIASSFKETSPLAAVRVCIDRLKQALADLGLA